jgi:hypothetical protein
LGQGYYYYYFFFNIILLLVLIPTGKEVSAKDICRNKGNGRNDDNNNMQNLNNGGFCPPCGNFGCCPGQYCGIFNLKNFKNLKDLLGK